MATKIPKDIMKYFQRTGAEGGRARAERHTNEELSAWGKKGGRPKGSGKKQAKSKATKGER
ncbi:MAG TPA: hypothetical protein VN736_17765 [Candidatus Limnocylindrales bacterium]|nr:hypothetical protein [Candidatus Limnocylindrales bacterium]